jgi:hypothetical protein
MVRSASEPDRMSPRAPHCCVHNRLVVSSSPTSPTTQSHVNSVSCGFWKNLRISATFARAGASFPVSAGDDGRSRGQKCRPVSGSRKSFRGRFYPADRDGFACRRDRFAFVAVAAATTDNVACRPLSKPAAPQIRAPVHTEKMLHARDNSGHLWVVFVLSEGRRLQIADLDITEGLPSAAPARASLSSS